MSESPYAALKIADFRLLLISRLMVTVAVQVQCIAVGWQIYALTHNPLDLGLAGLAEALPNIAVALYAGHVADQVDRRKIAMSAVAVLVLSLAILTYCSYTQGQNPALLAIIYSVIALTGLARGFYGPAIFSIIADIVPREHYGNAAAWNATVWQSSALAGPVIGGFLYGYYQAPLTYLVSTLLLVGAFFCFYTVKSRSAIPEKTNDSIIENIKEGLRFVFNHQILLAAMALDLFAVLFGGAVALLPMFAKEVFHMGPQVLGMLRAAPSLGAVIIAFILTHRPLSKNSGAWLLASVATFGACMIAFGLSTNFYVSLALLALSGAVDGVSVWVRSTIFQLVTPNDMKGRVSAVNNIFIGSSNEIGEFESGVAAKLLGLVPSVVFGGCMTLLVVITTLFKAPKLRSLHVESLYKDYKPTSPSG